MATQILPLFMHLKNSPEGADFWQSIFLSFNFAGQQKWLARKKLNMEGSDPQTSCSIYSVSKEKQWALFLTVESDAFRPIFYTYKLNPYNKMLTFGKIHFTYHLPFSEQPFQFCPSTILCFGMNFQSKQTTIVKTKVWGKKMRHAQKLTINK